jgi:eukaryotic-like serine/threonine-protein kinase
VRIGRSFAIAAKAVTFEQYRKCVPGYDVGAGYENFTRMPNLPVVGIDWYMAASYCNWLSKQEKIPENQWCYETNEKGEITQLREHYLSLTGYRLPNAAEMEYGTRAGAVTSRYFGQSDELLEKYAWYRSNSDERTWPVGSRKPNDLGFFDLHGNAYCWCQEQYSDYPVAGAAKVIEDSERALETLAGNRRVVRGGSFSSAASFVRSASRDVNVPTDRSVNVGFRAARTLPLDPAAGIRPW